MQNLQTFWISVSFCQGEISLISLLQSACSFRVYVALVRPLLGLIAAPTVIFIGLGIIYERYQNDAHIAHMFAGLAAAAGLLITTALKMASPLQRKPLGILIAVTFFVAIALLRFPFLPTMLVLVPVGIFVTWRWTS